MSYEVQQWWRRYVVLAEAPTQPGYIAKIVVASCPTREAAEAARRLLSGECERGLADAQIDRLVAEKTGPGKQMLEAWESMREESYETGVTVGRAQERARIVAWLRDVRALTCAAEDIEKGEHER